MRGTRLTAAILVLTFRLAWADPSEDAQRFLKVPGARGGMYGGEMNDFKADALPAGVRDIVSGYDWGNPDGTPPVLFKGYALDLNNDGRKEYFITTMGGGSGGPAFILLARMHGKWKEILSFQGGFYVVPTKGEWPRIVTIGRGGGENFLKTQYQFSAEGYREVHCDRYERGEITRIVPKSDK